MQPWGYVVILLPLLWFIISVITYTKKRSKPRDFLKCSCGSEYFVRIGKVDQPYCFVIAGEFQCCKCGKMYVLQGKKQVPVGDENNENVFQRQFNN